MLIEPAGARRRLQAVTRPAAGAGACQREKKRAPEGARRIACGAGTAGPARRDDQNRWIMPTRKPLSSRPVGFDTDAPVVALVALRYGLMLKL